MPINGATISAKVWRGFAIAASKLGTAFNHHRPRTLTQPLAPATRLGTLTAAFDPSPTLKFTAAPNREAETRAVLVDGVRIRVGDYLTGNGQTYFIASREPLLPVQAVLCNATVDVLRLSDPNAVGDIGYGHDTGTAEAVYMAGWPASLLLRGATSGGTNPAGIPGVPNDPAFEMLLPVLPANGVLNTGDVVRDGLGRRLLVTAAERTAHGWRCNLRLVAGG